MKKTGWHILSIVLLLAVPVLFSYANLAHYTAHMDADVAAEAVLARQIGSNGLRTPDTWVTSTETRLTYPANLAGCFYAVTGNMNLSMGIACTVCMWLLAGLMLLFYHGTGLRGMPLATAVLLPFVLSVNTAGAGEMYALYAGYYIPVLAGMFLVLRLKKTRYAALILAVAVLLGAQGMRGMLMVFLPVAAVEVLRILPGAGDSTGDGSAVQCFSAQRTAPLCCPPRFRPAVISFVAAILSFLTARFFSAGMTGTGRNLRHAPEKLLREVLPSVRDLFTPAPHPVYTLCVALITAAGFLYPFYVILRGLIRRGSKDTSVQAAWSVLPLHVSFLVMAAAMTFTTAEVAARYSIFLLFAAGAGYGLLLRDILSRKSAPEDGDRVLTDDPGRRRHLPVYAAVLPVIACALFTLSYDYRHLIAEDGSADSACMRIARVMEEEGVTRGYATFDWAGTITVVSNDAVQVCAVSNMTDLEGAHWLSDAAWYPPMADADRAVCYITTAYTEETFRDTVRAKGIQVQKERTVEDFTLFFTDRDHTVWKP